MSSDLDAIQPNRRLEQELQPALDNATLRSEATSGTAAGASRVTIVFWSLLVLAFLPGLARRGLFLWNADAIRLFPIVYILLAWIIIRSSSLEITNRPRRTWLARIFLVLTCVVGSLGYIVDSSWVIQLGFAAGVSAYLFVHSTEMSVRRIFLVGLFASLLGLPPLVSQSISDWHLALSIATVSGFLDYFTIPFFRQSSVFEVNGGLIDVSSLIKHAESVITGFIICGTFAIARRRSLFVTLLLALSVPVVAVVASSTMALLDLMSFQNTALGFLQSEIYHDLFWMALLSIFFVGVAVALTEIFHPIPPPNNNDLPPLAVAAFNQIVCWPLRPEENSAQRMSRQSFAAERRSSRSRTEKVDIVEIQRQPIRLVRWFVIVLPLLCLAGLCVVNELQPKQIVAYQMSDEEQSRIPQPSNTELSGIAFANANWQRLDREKDNAFGPYSSVWTVNEESGNRVLAIDYPVSKNHSHLGLLKRLGFEQTTVPEMKTTSGGVEFYAARVTRNDSQVEMLICVATITDADSALVQRNSILSQMHSGPLGLLTRAGRNETPEFAASITMTYQSNYEFDRDKRELEIQIFSEALDSLSTKIEESFFSAK